MRTIGTDTARRRGRTGLELPIARSLVESHGGQIILTSTPGKGTLVTVQLPLAHQATSFTERIGHLAGGRVDRQPSPEARHVARH